MLILYIFFVGIGVARLKTSLWWAAIIESELVGETTRTIQGRRGLQMSCEARVNQLLGRVVERCGKVTQRFFLAGLDMVGAIARQENLECHLNFKL